LVELALDAAGEGYFRAIVALAVFNTLSPKIVSTRLSMSAKINAARSPRARMAAAGVECPAQMSPSFVDRLIPDVEESVLFVPQGIQ
jgi:hypothetical protein